MSLDQEQRRGQWQDTFMCQLGEVLEESDDASVRNMPVADKESLWEQANTHFAAELQQCCPPPRAIRRWIRATLGVPEGSYGSESGGEEEDGGDATRPRPQHQQLADQRQQQLQHTPPAPLRRSTRPNRGQRRGGGTAMSHQPQPHLQDAPMTPAAPSRRQQRRGGRRR